MPSGITIFAAQYLVYIEALLALGLLLVLLRTHGWSTRLQWGISAVLTLVLSELAAQVAAHLYSDPRPFTQDHVAPLISHAADNGFPSDHALLAAALAAVILLLSWRWALVLIPLAVAVDWARVGSGLHHVVDVVGSSLIVAGALLLAAAIAPWVARAVAARVHGPWFDRGPRTPSAT